MFEKFTGFRTVKLFNKKRKVRRFKAELDKSLKGGSPDRRNNVTDMSSIGL